MADIQIMKAVEFDKLPAKFRKQYPHLDALKAAGYWLQRKYDGCFGKATLRADGKHTMESRTGEDYTTSCQHLLNELAEAGEEWLRGGTGFVVLGEVWHPTWPFPTISGKFRKGAPCRDLHFVANDLVPMNLNTGALYYDRLLSLNKLLPPSEVAKTYVAETHKSHCWDDTALDHAIRWKAEGGFDGAILRNPMAGYTVGLVKAGEIVKVKPVLSLDLRVERIGVGVGGKTGRSVYTLDVIYRDVLTTVGSGVPHSQDALPALGDIIEVECMGLTDDGKLREPRFKGIRHDKEQPDA